MPDLKPVLGALNEAGWPTTRLTNSLASSRRRAASSKGMGWWSQAARMVAIWNAPHHGAGSGDAQVAAMRANYRASSSTPIEPRCCPLPGFVLRPHPRQTGLAAAAGCTAWLNSHQVWGR